MLGDSRAQTDREAHTARQSSVLKPSRPYPGNSFLFLRRVKKKRAREDGCHPTRVSRNVQEGPRHGDGRRRSRGSPGGSSYLEDSVVHRGSARGGGLHAECLAEDATPLP